MEALFENPDLFAKEYKHKQAVLREEASDFMAVFAYNIGCLRSHCFYGVYRGSEWTRLSAEHALLMEFLKNMDEDDCKPFNSVLTTPFKSLGADSPSILEDIYHDMDLFINKHSLLGIKSAYDQREILVSSDMPESMSLYCTMLRLTAEYSNGHSDLSSTHFYKECWQAWEYIIEREQENIHSSLNNLKLSIAKHILSMVEGGELDVVVFYGQKLTISRLLEVIRKSLKSLYVYSLVSTKKHLYRRFVAQALEKLKARQKELLGDYDEQSIENIEPYIEVEIMKVPRFNTDYQKYKDYKYLIVRINHFERLLLDEDTSILPSEVLEEVQINDISYMMNQYLT